jgi:hypothetical protein
LAEPLGDIVYRFPENPWPEQPRFLGYRLDAARAPIFRYSISGTEVQDAFRPLADGHGFRRVLTVRGEGASLRFVAARGKTIEKTAAETFDLGGGISLRIEGGGVPVLTDANGEQELAVPIAASPKGTQVITEVRW